MNDIFDKNGMFQGKVDGGCIEAKDIFLAKKTINVGCQIKEMVCTLAAIFFVKAIVIAQVCYDKSSSVLLLLLQYV